MGAPSPHRCRARPYTCLPDLSTVDYLLATSVHVMFLLEHHGGLMGGWRLCRSVGPSLPPPLPGRVTDG